MGTKKRKGDNTPVIQFQTDDSDITVTFSQEESVGVKAVILDILTGAPTDSSPIRQGRMIREGLRCRILVA